MTAADEEAAAVSGVSAVSGLSAVTAVILCGGEGRRFGGDKTRAELGGRVLLDHLLDGLPPQWPVVCVGPQRPTSRPVHWVREEPPGGGPVAAIAAALAQVESPTLVLLGGDMPYAGAAAARVAARLARPSTAAPTSPEVVAALDGEGRVQPLLAAYRAEALRGALPHPAAGTPLMRLLDRLRVETVVVEAPASLDVDNPGDLDDARHRLEP
jgi:molybdopterin-guanine dinucleotide biosynthesis protein A